jgi:hypothetical protein
LPTADGRRSISDAVIETCQLCQYGACFTGAGTAQTKKWARFHFDLPGSVQGPMLENSGPECGVVRVENIEGFSVSGSRSLAVHYQGLAMGCVGARRNPYIYPFKVS